MATLATIRTDVRSRLDESAARFWSNTELDRYINEAARDVARRCEVLQDTNSINLISNTQEYTLPTTTIRVYRVEHRTAGGQVYPLEYRDFNNMDAVWWSSQTTSRGRPYFFTMWGFPPTLKMIVYPTPSSADGTFKVYYYRLPATAAADGDNLDIPQGWEDMIALYCEYISLRKDADPRWSEAKGLYEEKVTELNDMTRRWSDQAGAITVNNSTIPAWLYSGDGF